MLILQTAGYFEARSSDEITFKKGDAVVLIERDDGFKDGWYLGQHQVNHKVGLFPAGS
jgi:hypothetical protein